MRSAICLISLVSLLLVGVPSIGAQDATQPDDPASDATNCVNPLLLSTALIDCGTDLLSQLDTTAELDASSEVAGDIEALDAPASALETSEAFFIPSYCRLKVEAIFWGGTHWFELAQSLAADYSVCAEYYVSIPPQDNNINRTQLRARARFDEVRELDAPIHPVAEIRWTSDGGWRRWVVGPSHVDGWVPGRTFYGAGVTARRRMAQRGLDVTAGETWAFNELTVEVLENAPVTDGPHAGEGARVEVLEFMRGLYDGAPGMPKARGIVFNVAPRSDVNDLTEYKEHLQSWLEDDPFWTELDIYANFFAHEVYASSRNWGVADAPLATRARYLNYYFHHPTILAESGPATIEAARSFLRRTYVPLGNAAWPHPNIGNTNLLSDEAMRHFISTQVYAMRHYANAHPQTAPQGRLGFGWAPLANFPGYSEAGRKLIGDRLASAIHHSSEEGGNSQMGACGLPDAHVWCGLVEVENASLNAAWKTFASWD